MVPFFRCLDDGASANCVLAFAFFRCLDFASVNCKLAFAFFRCMGGASATCVLAQHILQRVSSSSVDASPAAFHGLVDAPCVIERLRTAHTSKDAQTKRGGSCTPSWEHSLSASGTGRQKGRLFGARGVDASCRRLHFARYSLHITTQADTRHLSLHNHLQIAGVPRTRTGLFSGSMCWAGAVIGVAPCSTDSWWRCPER